MAWLSSDRVETNFRKHRGLCKTKQIFRIIGPLLKTTWCVTFITWINFQYVGI